MTGSRFALQGQQRENVVSCRGFLAETQKFMRWHTQLSEEFELYHLANDPNAIHNLYDEPEHTAVRASLVKTIAALRRHERMPGSSAIA